MAQRPNTSNHSSIGIWANTILATGEVLSNYENDVVMLAQTLHGDDIRSQINRDNAYIRKVAHFLSHFQCSKVQKILQLNGLGDQLDEHIDKQMTRKHQTQKMPISPLSDKECLHC